MAEPATARVQIGDFGGLTANSGPLETPAGVAIDQVNITSLIPGEAVTRGGYRPVVFEA